MDNQCPQGLRHHLQGVRQCRRHLTKGIHRSPAVDPRAGTGREVAGAGMAIVGFGPRTMEMAMVVATVPQPYEAPLRPQLTGTTVATTGGAIDRRRLGGCHDPSPKNDGCGACSYSYSLHRRGQTPPPPDRPMPPPRTETQPPRPGWTHHWRRSRGHWRWNGQRWVWVWEKWRL